MTAGKDKEKVEDVEMKDAEEENVWNKIFISIFHRFIKFTASNIALKLFLERRRNFWSVFKAFIF